MQNWQGVVEATNLALNSNGSAMKENQVFQESLQGQVNSLSSAFSKFANESLDSEFVSSVLKSTTAILNFITAIGGLPTILTAVTTALIALNFSSVSTSVLGLVSSVKDVIVIFGTYLSTLVTTKSTTQAYEASQIALTFATNGATAATIGLKLALGGIIALGVVGVMYAFKKSTEETTVSLEDQIASLKELQGEVDKLKTEIADLSSKNALTDDEKTRLGLLKEILEVKREIAGIEEEQIQLTQYSEAYKAVEDLRDGTDEAIESFKELAKKMNGEEMTPKNLGKVDEAQKQLKQTYLDLSNALVLVNQALLNADEGQKNGLETQLKYLEQSLKTIQALLGLEDATKNATSAASENKTEAEKQAEAYNALNEYINGLSSATDSVVADINELNSAIATQTAGMSLSASEVDGLLKKYPQLQGQIQVTSDGYRIETSVLEQLRGQANSTFSDEINGQISVAQQRLQSEKDILNSIAREIQALAKLQTAWNSYTTTTAVGKIYSRTSQSYVADRMAQEAQKDMDAKNKEYKEQLGVVEDAQKAIDTLMASQQRATVATSNLGNAITSATSKASGATKEIKDYADEIAKLGKTITETAKDLTAFKKSFDYFKKGYVNDAFKEQKMSIQELEKGYESAKKTLASLTSQYNTLKKNTKGDEAKEKLDEINDKIKEQQTLITELTNQAKEYNEALKTLALDKLKTEQQGLNDVLTQTITLIKHEKDLEKEKYQQLIDEAKKANSTQLEVLKERVEAEEDAIDAQIEALKDSTDERKKLIKEESDAQEKALQSELKTYQDLINKRKELLDSQEEERTYQEQLSEKQKELLDLQQKLQELSAVDTLEGKTKRLELEEEIANKEKEITDLQHNWDITKQKETLDKMLADKEEQINNKIDAVKEGADEESDALDKAQDEEEKRLKQLLKDKEAYLKKEEEALKISLEKQTAEYQGYIDKIDTYLKEEGTIRLDAMARIDSEGSALYDKLLEYNKKYGDGVDSTITSAWTKAQTAMEKYGEAQNKVLSALGKMDAIEDFTNSGGGITVDKNNDDKILANGGILNETNELKKKRENMQTYYHNQMVEAEKTGNEGLAKWVREQRKANQFDPESGKDLYKYHTGGIAGGDDEASLKSTEIFAKLMKGEFVSTENQAQNFLTKTLPNLIGMNGKTVNNTSGDTYVLTLNTNGGAVDSSTYDKLRAEIKKMIDSVNQNKAMFVKGNTRNARSLSI